MPEPAILYVDDDAGNLTVFKLAFLQEFNVLTADSAKAATELLKQHEVAVILSDQRMPKMTGTEFFKSIQHLYPDTVRMIMTAYTDIEVVISAVNDCGIFRYMTKPWNQEELKLALVNAHETYTLRKRNRMLIDELQAANKKLNDSLDETRRMNTELAQHSVEVLQKNENMAKVKDQLAEAIGNIDREMQSLKSMQSQLNTALRGTKHWKEFLNIFEKVNQEFYQKLSRMSQDLSPGEMKLCALIKMNMGNKEVAQILGISPQSVNMARYRLKKKLAPDQDLTLEQLLLSL